MRVKSVEIWRLLFSVSIVFCHAMYLPWNTDAEGNMLLHVNSIGVEFFFILSGFLMARSACRTPPPQGGVGSETTAFLLKKLKPIYPVFLFAAILELAVRFVLRSETADGLVWNIWDFLFLRAFGLGNSTELLVGASWFLFALFPAMWMLYPLLRKYTNTFLHIIAPLIALFLFGWFERRYGNINYALHTNDVNICLGLLRAIAELCIGCVTYSVCESLKQKFKSDKPSVLVTVAEVVCLAIIFPFGIYGTRSKTDFLCILLICIGLIAAFSGKSYTNILLKEVPNSLIASISVYSLSLYLNHYVWLRTLQSWKLALPYNISLLIYMILSLLTAFVCLTTIRTISAVRTRVKGKRVTSVKT